MAVKVYSGPQRFRFPTEIAWMCTDSEFGEGDFARQSATSFEGMMPWFGEKWWSKQSNWSALSARLRSAAPVLFLTGVILLIFWPILFGGYTLYPADLLHETYLPYAAHRSGTNVQVTAINDYLHVFYPWRFFIAEAFRSSSLPIWNPYVLGGHPALASNGSVVTLDPFNMLFLVMNLPSALAWRTFLQDLFCAVFMYLYLRYLQLGQAAAVLGGLAFAMNSMFYANIFDWSLNGILWLPLALLLVERALESGDLSSGVAAGLVLGIGLLASPFQIAGFMLFAVIVIVSVKHFWSSGSLTILKRHVSMTALVICVGLLVFSVQLIPTLELLRVNARHLPLGVSMRPPGQMLLATGALVTFIFPNLGGRLKEGMLFAEAWGGTTHFQGYIGVLPFVLATIAVFRLPKRRTLPYLLLGLGTVGLVLYTPLGAVLYERFFIIYIFGACVLAAMGLDHLVNDSNEPAGLCRLLRPFLWLFTAVAVGTALWGLIYWAYRAPILAWADAYLQSILAPRYLGYNIPLHMRKLRNALHDLTLFSSAMYVPLGVAFASVALIRLRVLKKLGSGWFVAVALVLVAFELVYSARTHVPFVRLETYPLFPPVAALKPVQSDPGLFRVMSLRRYGLEPPLISSAMMVSYGLQGVEGKDNLYPQNLLTILPKSFSSGESTLPTDFRLLDVENVKYVVVGPQTVLPEGHFDLMDQRGGIRVYRNRRVMPRAFFISDYVVLSDDKRALEFLHSRQFDPHTTVILESDPGLPPPAAGDEGTAEVHVTGYEATMVEIEAEVSRAGLLVLSDTYYPGWRAFVDGRPAAILRANIAMRAIVLVPGRHRIQFVYRPLSFRLGLAISGGTLLLGLIVWATSPRRLSTPNRD